MATLDAMNAWCRANGISAALVQKSQRSAKDLLDELFIVGNSAPVYSGDELKVIPYDEVSAAGNGAIYIAPTASGPLADLSYSDDRDYAGGIEAPVKLKRGRRANCDNVVSIEFIDRSIDYARNIVTEVDQRAVALYGPRKGGTLNTALIGQRPASGTQSFSSISNAAVAQAIGSILVRRSAAGVNRYSFTLSAQWFWLEAMDLVQITDRGLGAIRLPVRIVSTKETPKRTWQVEADEFIYGLNHPRLANTTNATGSLVTSNIDPGLVNPPIIFEPRAAMLNGGAPQVCFLVSGEDPNFGGSGAYVSVDGGASYQPLGNCPPATTGVLTADYPSGSDPDTADTLAVDLTESDGSLTSNSNAVADGFADPCYIAGASGFEVVCPTTATLTAACKYNLTAHIRRGTLGTSIMDHPSGSRFAVVARGLEVDLPQAWIGKTLYFKFAAYNQSGGQQNDLSACAAYTYTPAGSGSGPQAFLVNGS